jgi:ankyrin repeat protein
LYELAVIAGLPEEDRNDEDAIIGHVHHCGAFTQIFDDDGKSSVQLSYNSVRDYLKSKSNDWLSMPSEQIQHGIISLRCFEYVLAAVRKATAINRAKNDAENENEEVDSEKEEEEEENNEEHEVKQDDEEEDNREINQIEEQNNEENDENDQVQEEDGSENDEHVVLEPVATDDETQEPDLMPLDYPYTEWIEHALEATPDIVESFGLEDVFWVLGSEERAEWSRSYSNLNDEEEFDINFTALHIAAYFGYVPLANLLLRNEAHVAELGIADSNGHQPLYWACKRGRMNMVQKLCEQGADINGGTIDDTATAITPLHGAASSGVVEIVEYLLNKGATVDVPSEADGTALYVAAEDGFLPIVQILLDRGADPNIVGGGELTPLNAAALGGNLEIVQLLLSKGAELNPEIDYHYGNAVAVAAFYGNLEVVKFLLEKGCRFDIGDSDNEYPLSLAAREDYPDIVRVILKYDKRPESHDQALASAAETNRVECLRVIIERCPVLQRTEPFRIAARNGFTEILNVLTNSGIAIEDLNGALYEATEYQHIDTVATLLEMSADPNAEGEEYACPLQSSPSLLFVGKLILEQIWQRIASCSL